MKPSARSHLITGATGLLGSHIAEQLAARGENVRALVRPSSDTRFLRQLHVPLIEGDLQDPASIRRAVIGTDIVYHCAARVSDWGPWSQFEREIVSATRNLVEACRAEQVGRLLHVSSISVYGNYRAKDGLVSEDAPLGHKLMLWDYYPRAKILAEKVVGEYGGNVTVVRPSWIYGERDRITIPRVIPALREGRVPVLGTGENLLNIIYAGDVAAGAILAAHHPGAAGQVYNLCSEGEVTQRQLLDTLTDALGLPRIRKRVPLFLAARFAFVKEMLGRLLRRAKPPTITRRAIYLIGRPTLFSTAKARAELGWQPKVDIHEGIRRALGWYLGSEPANQNG
jgi:nucleoside-diphosphate-sugar epimerase